MLDAYAWLRASYRDDTAEREALARSVDPVRLVDSLTGMLIWHLLLVTDDPVRFLDRMTAETVRNREAC